MNKGVKVGHPAVFRNANLKHGKFDDGQRIKFNGHKIQNKSKKCLEVQNKKISEEAALQWWNCNGGAHQKFNRVYQIKKLPPPNFNK